MQRLRVAKGTDGTYSLVEREEILQGTGRVRDVECAPDGSLVVVLEGVDKIVRLVPAEICAPGVESLDLCFTMVVLVPPVAFVFWCRRTMVVSTPGTVFVPLLNRKLR